MICRNCDKQIEDDSTFCPYCGSAVNGQAEQEKAQESKTEERCCTQCGTVNPADADFCYVCGSKLTDKVRNGGEKPYRINGIRYAVAALIAVLIVVTALCISHIGKISNKEYQKALTALSEFCEEEIFDEYEYSAARMVLDADGMPMLATLVVADRSSNTGYFSIYAYHKKDVKKVFDIMLGNDIGSCAPSVFSDGIVESYDFEEEIRYWYQVSKGEAKEVAYYDERNGEMHYLISEEELVLSFAEAENNLDEGYSEEYKAVCRALYKDAAKIPAYNYIGDIYSEASFGYYEDMCFLMSPVIIQDDESIFLQREFRDQVECLRQEGAVTQEEFWVNSYRFMDTVYNRNKQYASNPPIACLIYRNMSRLNELADYAKAEDKGNKEMLLCLLTECAQSMGNTKGFRDLEILNRYTKREMEEMLKAQISLGDSNARVSDYLNERAIQEFEEQIQGADNIEYFQCFPEFKSYVDEEAEGWKEEYISGGEIFYDAYKEFERNYKDDFYGDQYAFLTIDGRIILLTTSGCETYMDNSYVQYIRIMLYSIEEDMLYEDSISGEKLCFWPETEQFWMKREGDPREPHYELFHYEGNECVYDKVASYSEWLEEYDVLGGDNRVKLFTVTEERPSMWSLYDYEPVSEAEGLEALADMEQYKSGVNLITGDGKEHENSLAWYTNMEEAFEEYKKTQEFVTFQNESESDISE